MLEDRRKGKREAYGRTGCSVPGCNRKHRSRGWCGQHYERFRLHGDPNFTAIAGRGEGLAWAKKNFLVEGDACLIWPFGKDANGYPCSFTGENGETKRAHHWATEFSSGPRPSSTHQAIHSCGNGHAGCVNPKHLKWGTAQENADDRIRHGRSKRGQQHWQSRFTDEQVASIKQMLGDGVKASEIARTFGVSRKTIGGIAEGRTWKWVGGDVA